MIGADTMHNQFIYVFDERDRDTLLAAGFYMLKEDTENSLFIFASDEGLQDVLDGMNYATSNTLTF